MDEAVQLNAPPKATLSRRAQSYSDFHYAITALLGGETSKAQSDLIPIEKDIKSDLDFSDWYDGLEDELLEASHEEYKYVPPRRSRLDPLRSMHAESLL